MHTRCHSPYIVTPDNHSHGDIYIPVGCGNCPYCTARRASEWAFRLMQEHKEAQKAYFVTLTYTNEALPRTPRGFKTLSKEDLQNFFKRLRYYHNKKGVYYYDQKIGIKEKKKIKYYAVGEYGSQTKRPHYHAIIFNAHEQDIYNAWDKKYSEVLMCDVPIGSIHIGTVTYQSCSYVMKYMDKESKKPYGYPWDGLPEFSVQSKYLGHNYLTDEMIKWHKDDYTRQYSVLPGGYKVPLSRYYRDRIFTDENERKKMLEIIGEEMEYQYLAEKKKAERKGKNYHAVIQHTKNAERNARISNQKRRS